MNPDATLLEGACGGVATDPNLWRRLGATHSWDIDAIAEKPSSGRR